MKRHSRHGVTRREVHAFVRDRLEAGIRPTLGEIGAKIGISKVMAWKHVQTLIGEGKLVATDEKGGFALPGWTDLSAVPSGRLRDELARRGVTLDALEQPGLPTGEGRPCAAHHCFNRVPRGHLMCRKHWLGLPGDLRWAIRRAWGVRDGRAYSEAVEAARDHFGGFTRVVERAL